MQKPIISADSHITEPPGCYVDRIDRKYKDTAPHMVHDEKMGDIFVIEGSSKPIPMCISPASCARRVSVTIVLSCELESVRKC